MTTDSNLDALLANERDWAIDRQKRDVLPDPLDPVHHPDATTLPDLPEAWLLPSLTPEDGSTGGNA